MDPYPSSISKIPSMMGLDRTTREDEYEYTISTIPANLVPRQRNELWRDRREPNASGPNYEREWIEYRFVHQWIRIFLNHGMERRWWAVIDDVVVVDWVKYWIRCEVPFDHWVHRDVGCHYSYFGER